MANTTKRIMVRIADEDDLWLAEQAADEGVDKATLLRMLVNRMRRGRPPLMSMVLRTALTPLEQRLVEAGPGGMVKVNEYNEPITEPLPAEEVDAVLGQRLAELEEQPAMPESAPESVNGAAVSLRHVPRASYNPGRQ